MRAAHSRESGLRDSWVTVHGSMPADTWAKKAACSHLLVMLDRCESTSTYVARVESGSTAVGDPTLMLKSAVYRDVIGSDRMIVVAVGAICINEAFAKAP